MDRVLSLPALARSLMLRVARLLVSTLLLPLFFAGGGSALAQSTRVVITSAPPFSITWDGNNGGFSSPEAGAMSPENAARPSTGSYAFGSTAFQPGGIHDFPNVVDGFYGNSSSWIPDFAANPPDPLPFIAVAFGREVAVRSIAWSRDNGDATEPSCGGTCTDRALGLYTLQFTRAASPESMSDTGNATTGWQTIGTVEYLPGTDNSSFTAYLRHRFDVAEGENPITATAIRILAPNVNTCIDEIEVNPPEDVVPPLLTFIAITNAPGFSVSWDLNDGAFHTAASPAPAPPNRALTARGTTAFASSELGAGTHFITNVNDGLYGNVHSWIPADPDTTPFVGLSFGGLVNLKYVAWSRDNGDDTADCCGGELADRALGLYTLQVTTVPSPGADTPETGDPQSGWVTIGTLDYRSPGAPFTPHRRHRYSVALENGSPIAATGIRLKTPVSAAIDEIEINPHPALEQDLTSALALTPQDPYTLEWDGNDGEFSSPAAGARAPLHAGLASSGGVAFGSSELGFGIHFVSKINDGLYGNSSSWISANGLGGSDDPDPFVGIAFTAPVEITSLAWGRDNGDTTEGGCGGTCEDRWRGIYTVQVTRAQTAGVDTQETGDAATGWETMGTVDYLDAAPPGFNPSRRHAFSVSRGGQPIVATAIRLKVSDGNIAIDELEVNPAVAAVEVPLSDLLTITPSSGFSIVLDQIEGEFSSAQASPPARDNVALSSRGSVAFGSGELGLGTHFITNINDGIYGNAHSWIPAASAGADSYIGVRLPVPTLVRSIAFGRDNGDATDCCGGTLTDRALGVYTLQFTRVAEPGTATTGTGDSSTGWQTLGELQYKGGATNVFLPHVRHRYDVREGESAILATGVRLVLSSDQIAIDELEINPMPSVDQNVLFIQPAEGFTIVWDGNNGDYGTTNSPARVPANDALAGAGAVAFGSTEVGLDTHFITNINDGLYGNAHSWIADFVNGDEEPWVGVRFVTSVMVSSVAWGRDNGDVAGDCCGGTLTDRAAGAYTLEYTQVADAGVDTVSTDDPTTGWATIGRIEYRGGGTAAFQQYLRHEFVVSRDGAPISATAVRLRVPDSSIAIDELEVNTRPQFPEGPVPPVLTFARQGGSLVLTWSGEGTLQERAALGSGDWTDAPGASPVTVTPEGPAKFYRVRR